ncbi:hypothetical protein Tco_0123794 [Tanacetum coccineum]
MARGRLFVIAHDTNSLSRTSASPRKICHARLASSVPPSTGLDFSAESVICLVGPGAHCNDMSQAQRSGTPIIRHQKNTCNNDKNLSEIQLEHEKEDELVAVVVKVVHELDCMMVVKEIENGLLEEVEVSLFKEEVMILSGCLTFQLVLPTFWFSSKRLNRWFEQDIEEVREDG